jgi:hypothetical protein
MGGQCHTLATSSPGSRPGTHFTGAWLDLRVGLRGSKIYFPPQHLNPRPSSLQSVTMLTVLFQAPWTMNRISNNRTVYCNKIYALG